MACMPVHMVGMPVQLLGLTLLPPPISTSELCVFVVFRHVLMVCIMTLCPFDASDWLQRPSVASTSGYTFLVSNVVLYRYRRP